MRAYLNDNCFFSEQFTENLIAEMGQGMEQVWVVLILRLQDKAEDLQ